MRGAWAFNHFAFVCIGIRPSILDGCFEGEEEELSCPEDFGECAIFAGGEFFYPNGYIASLLLCSFLSRFFLRILNSIILVHGWSEVSRCG